MSKFAIATTSFTEPRRPAALFASLLAGAAILLVPSAFAAKDGDKIKDWTVACEKDKDKKPTDRCFIVQTVVNGKDNPVLQMSAGYLKSSNKPAAFLTLPLGVSLPAGISLKIDEHEPVRTQYERCIPSGCVAGLMLTDELMKALKGGTQIKVQVYDGDKPVTMPISLKGFGPGFDGLKKK